MSFKHFISSINCNKIISYFFTIAVFVLPFISYPFVLNSTKVGQELYLVSVIAFWLFCGGLFVFKNKSLSIRLIDILFLAFLFYCILHYYYYSFFGFLHNGFWVFSSYIVLFYLFKWSFSNEKYRNVLFDFTVKLIWILAIIQSIIGLSQEFNLLKSGNEFFKVVGTFINPNFLGISMVLGITASLYLFCFSFSENKFAKLLLAFSSILMVCVLVLTQSRAAWLALCVAILVFFGTSPKSILFIKTNKSKSIGLFFTIVLVGFLSLYGLYQMGTDSVDGRGFIRKIITPKIVENPILGNGISNFSGIYNQSKTQYFLEKQRPWEEIKIGDYVAYAFNDYVQIVFEIGFVGLFLMGILLYYILKKTILNPQTRFALSLLVCLCFLGVFTSVLYNPNAMIYVIWTLAILVVFGEIRKPIRTTENQFIIRVIAVLIIAISGFTEYIFYKKTAGLSKFKIVSESSNQRIYYKLNDFDLLFIKEDPYLEFQLGYENYLMGNPVLGIQLMENSIKKDPIPKANIALSNLYLQQKDYRKTENLLLYNLGIEPSRFEPYVNLMNFYTVTKSENKKIAIANKIINLPVKIPSVTVDKYKKTANEIVLLPLK